MATTLERRTEAERREEIIQVCRLLGQKGFVSATDGNVSVRLGDGLFLATPSGFSKPFLSPEQLILVDGDSCTWKCTASVRTWRLWSTPIRLPAWP